MNDDRHLTEAELHDLAEDLLSPAESAAARSHLRSCGRCAGEVAALRDLIGGIGTLPRAVAPGADLRPEIRRRVQRAMALRDRRRALRALRWPLAAAAAVLVIATAAVTAALMDRGAVAPGVAVESPDSTGLPAAHALSPRSEAMVPAAFRAAEAEYQRTAAELMGVLERQRDALSPETVRLVEENLRTVELALEETRQALAADPASAVIRDVVLASHERRIEMLRWATAIAGET